MELKGKVIAITGGGRGLGRAMATEFAAKGAKLALLDLSIESLEETAKLCEEAGSEAKCYTCDVANEDQVVETFDKIVADFNALDGLINNAGITRDAMFVKAKEGKVTKKMTMAQWQLVMDVNLTGTFLCGREAACKMIELGTKGVLINISSVSRHGNMGQTNYSATKAGVEAMAVVWAKELSRYGIRAASIAPGFIATEMVLGMKPEALEKVENMIPLRRLGQPAEIASTAMFIFENDYISGRCFEIDGALRV